jgi:hypothetical protein
VPDPNDLLTPIMIHAGLWIAIGAVGGLSFAVGMGRHERVLDAIGGACAGALLATVATHLVIAGFSPSSPADDPIASSSFLRLASILPATVLIALGAARGTLSRTGEASAQRTFCARA